MRMLKIGLLLLLATVALAGCAATKMDRNSALDKGQYAYSAAIRWGDFEGAWNLVDPEYRKAHPMTRPGIRALQADPDLRLSRHRRAGRRGHRDARDPDRRDQPQHPGRARRRVTPNAGATTPSTRCGG